MHEYTNILIIYLRYNYERLYNVVVVVVVVTVVSPIILGFIVVLKTVYV